MKKILPLLFLCCFISVVFSGCGGRKSDKKQYSTPQPIQPESSMLLPSPIPEPEITPTPEPIPLEKKIKLPEISVDKENSASNQKILKQIVPLAKLTDNYKKIVADLAKKGIETDAEPKDGILFFTCIFSGKEYEDLKGNFDVDSATDSAEKEISALKNTFDSLVNQMSSFGIKNPQVCCEAVDSEGNIFFREIINV